CRIPMPSADAESRIDPPPCGHGRPVGEKRRYQPISTCVTAGSSSTICNTRPEMHVLHRRGGPKTLVVHSSTILPTSVHLVPGGTTILTALVSSEILTVALAIVRLHWSVDLKARVKFQTAERRNVTLCISTIHRARQSPVTAATDRLCRLWRWRRSRRIRTAPKSDKSAIHRCFRRMSPASAGWAKAPTGPCKARPDDRLRAV